MKKFLFLLCALFFGLSAHSQATENVSFQKVVSFRGSFTTAERDLLDVPVGDVWMIYNSTTAILEYAREDDIWGAVGGGAADNLGADANRSLFTVSGSGTVATLNLNTVDSTHIKNGSIESNDFADNSITTVKILNGTIVGADLANDAILTGKIADGTILPADLDAINAPVVGYHLALDASNQFVWVTPTAGSVAALADLSDVSSAIQGNRFVLVSNGTTFSSRALVEADISDLAHTVNTDDQNARQVSVLDAGARFDSINVEGVLEELYDKWVVGNDDQVLTFVSPNLSIENGNSVDLSALQDGTGTDDQTAAEVPVTTTNFNGHLSAADTNVQLALETLDDLVAGGSQTLSFTSPNLSISGGNSVDLSAIDTNTQRTDEEIQDVAGAMATGNTETLITVTYQDADGTMDYVVNSDLSLYNNATSNFSTGAHTVDTDDQTAAEVPSTPSGNLAASNVQAALDELQSDIDTRSVGAHTVNTDSQTLSFTSPNLSISGGNSVDLSAIDTNTQRTDEEIQDVVGAMVTTTNTETLITVTYQDATNDIDFVVNSDLSLYNNATSNFSTGAHTVDTDDQTAAEVPSTPSGNLAASNVQAALDELQTDIDGRAALSGATFTGTVQFNGIVNWNLGASAGNNLTMGENELQAVGLLDITRVGAGTNTIRQQFTSDTNFSIGPTVGGNALSYDYGTSTWNYKGSEVSYGAHTVNTDAQTLSFVSPNLSITGGNSVDLSGLVSGNYLPLAGGTLTGTTTINNDNGFAAPYFRSVTGGGSSHSTAVANNFDTEDHTAPTYSFWTSSNTTGSTGFPTATGQTFWVKGADDPRSFAFWKTNTDNDPDGLYSGYMNAGSWVWNEMWTSGSDGSGSGLDADLLDGVQLTENASTGPTWSRVPWMRSDGIMEFGRYIDFHIASASATDFDLRLFASNDQTLRMQAGGTTAQVEAYLASQDWSRIGANSSGGYLQLADGVGGTSTTIRGYSTSDFYGGNIVVHNGSVTATNFILSSDRRKKRRIRDYELQKLNVRWRSYFMNDDPMHLRYGVVAQELQKDHPEFIREDEDGMLSVSYVDLLVAKNAELEARIEDLEALVQQLIKEKK